MASAWCPISDSGSGQLTAPRPRVLAIDDDRGVATALELLLVRSGFEVAVANSIDSSAEAFARGGIDVVLLDLNLTPGARSGEDGLGLLDRFLALDADGVVVVLTAHSGVAIAVEAMRRGAADFIMKPWSNDKLVEAMSRAARLRTARLAGRLEIGGETPIWVGRSPCAQRALAAIESGASHYANILLVGEPGVGKEHFARVLHHRAGLGDERFCTLEPKGGTRGWAQVFGGVVGEGAPATVLLPDIDLLKTEEQDELAHRLAEVRALALPVRLISTTKSPSARLRSTGSFRPHLLAQISGVEIVLKSLNQRPEDIAPLVAAFSANYARRLGRPMRELSEGARRALEVQKWPGNIDTLRALTERAVLAEEGPELSAAGFGLDDHQPDPHGEDLNLDRAERTLLEKALARHRYNVTLAARDLGLTRAALYRRMERHGL